jgi:hypothetical protein
MVRFPVGHSIFYFSKASRPAIDPTQQPTIQWVRCEVWWGGLSPRLQLSERVAIHLHLVQRLRMSRSKLPPSNIPSQGARGQLDLYLHLSQCVYIRTALFSFNSSLVLTDCHPCPPHARKVFQTKFAW